MRYFCLVIAIISFMYITTADSTMLHFTYWDFGIDKTFFRTKISIYFDQFIHLCCYFSHILDNDLRFRSQNFASPNNEIQRHFYLEKDTYRIFFVLYLTNIS